jgi:hypothetical protein
MRSLPFLIIVFLLFSSVLFAQVGINDDNSEPDPAAGLDVKFTNKGFLPPRLSFTERNAIAGAPAGLIVWCTDCGVSGELQVYNGTIWTNMIGGAASVPFPIGMTYGGGVIFYVDNTGVHGLISAATDQSAGAQWGCFLTSIPGTSTAIGAGQDNTMIIINGCSEAGIAARICDDLVLNGYSDWFLPSQDELNQMYLQKNVIGGFANGSYWSSSEFSYVRALAHNFFDGFQDANQKTNTYYVRAVRAF